ncbi:MAG: helix-turn-helix transcriptional regulator [Arenicella sp.]|jgi:transcriptional regulator with XRE-family HTH domain|nr:helix-turn-helix transcriptional regulator [Arenicella sp.]
MNILPLSPDNLIQQELGTRLKKVRKQLGYTQAQLADASGIGVATLRRIEDGNDSQLSSWIKLLKALEMLNGIDQLLPEVYSSPMSEALNGNKRKRRTTDSSAPTSIWRDELE